MNGIYDEVRVALHAIWRRRWVALAVAWAIALAGWLVVSQFPNSYESTARVFVQLRTILPGQDSGLAQIERAKDIDRVRSTLTSAVNLEKVVRGTSIANTVANDRDVAARVASLQKAIVITATQENLFEVKATISNSGSSDAENAKLAQSVVQKLIDIFVEDNLASDRDETSQSLQFLDAQVEARQKALQDAEAKKADFEASFLASLPGTGSLADRVAGARSELQRIDQELVAARSSLTALNAQMAGTAASMPGGGGGAVAGPARARLSTIEGQIAEGRARGWTDAHPDMRALSSQLAQARAAARGEPTYGGGGGAMSNPIYLQLRSMQTERQARVAELTQRKAQLEGDLSTLQARIDADPAAAAEQTRIDRDLQVQKDQYQRLLTDREQVSLRAQVQTDTDAVKFSVIDPPTLPTSPAAPNRPLLLTGVLIVALFGGIGVAFALSQIRTSFSTASRLERASGMPVLGSVGEVLTAADTALRRKRLRLFAGGAAGLAAAWVLLLGVEFVQRGMVA